MAEQTQQSSNSATASQVGLGIGGILSGIGNNLWAAKERKRAQDWQSHMLNQSTAFSRQDAYTAYQRDLDYSSRMDAMRKAGINPFMVAGQSYSAPVAKGGGASSGPMAPGNFDFIGQIPMQMMQMKMMQAQIDNIKAEEANKIANLPILQQTRVNLEASFDLIKNDTKGSELKNLLLSIQGMFEKAQQSASLTSLEENNRLTRQTRLNAIRSGKKIDADIKSIAALTELTKAQIQLRLQDLQTGKLTQQKLREEIVTEAYRRGLIDQQTANELRRGENLDADTDLKRGENSRREGVDARDEIEWLKRLSPSPGKNGWFKF